MKNYEKPVVLMNEELAEGVYAASGDGDCWTLTYSVPQRWNGEGMVIELVATHSTELQHLSLGTVVTVTFDQPIVSARSESTEFVTSVSGTTVTAERNLLADSYLSGDRYTFKIFVNAGDQQKTEALNIVGTTIRCKKSVNVQGNGGDGN